MLQNYDTMSIDPKDFEGQTILILGRGTYIHMLLSVLVATMDGVQYIMSVLVQHTLAVCCLNSGNSGFETAQNIVGSTAYIHMASRSRVKQAYQTHYVGDLRAINNQLVDTYQLKSLDGFLGMRMILHVMASCKYDTDV